MFYRSGYGVSPILTLLDRLEGKQQSSPSSSSRNPHPSPRSQRSPPSINKTSPQAASPEQSSSSLRSDEPEQEKQDVQKEEEEEEEEEEEYVPALSHDSPRSSHPQDQQQEEHQQSFDDHHHQQQQQQQQQQQRRYDEPSIFEFLDEDDLLQECRANNPRLVRYLCRDENIRILINFAVRGIPIIEDEMMGEGEEDRSSDKREEGGEDDKLPNGEDEQTEEKKENSEEETSEAAGPVRGENEGGVEYRGFGVQGTRFYAADFEAKMRLKYPYVCAEVLSAEIAPLMDKILGSEDYSDLLFTCLNDYEEGELDPVLAAQFGKITVSFLKARNAETLAQMRKRKVLIPSMLRHLYLDPVTELFVRLLDPPGNDRTFHQSIMPPPQEALDLLSEHNIMMGFSEVFVKCLKPADHEERQRYQDIIANVITAINDLTHRMLQLPHMSIEIPSSLSLYATPQVVVKLLENALEQLEESLTPFLSAMRLINETLTTESNIKQDYDVLNPPRPMMNPAVLGRGRRPPFGGGGGGGMGPPFYGGGGGGGGGAPGRKKYSFSSPYSFQQHPEDEKEEEEEEEEERHQSPVDRLPVGASIISTDALEEVLRPKFGALSEMLGVTENDDAPLGSKRLKIAEFFAACLKVGKEETVQAVCDAKVPQKLLTLFVTYKWSSMLHRVVADSVKDSLCQVDTVRGTHSARAWISAGVIPWLIDTWHKGEDGAEDGPTRKCGYMGHLIEIGCAIQTFVERYMTVEPDEHDPHAENGESGTINMEKLKELYDIDEKTAEDFYGFCTNVLVPARKVEITPLCDDDLRPGSDNDEFFEEPTEVFDMSDVIDGLTHHNDAIENFTRQLLQMSGDGVIDEEEDVSVVDTDLSHFPDDGNDNSDDDEDAEREWERNRQRHRSSDHKSKNGQEKEKEKRKRKKGDPKVSSSKFLENIDEHGAIATIDSSDEDDDDEGTYEKFVADKHGANDLSSRFDRSVKVSNRKPPPSPAPYDVAEAVTEIDDGSSSSSAVRDQASSSDRASSANVIAEVEEEDVSSDEDDEGWVDFSEVEQSGGLHVEGDIDEQKMASVDPSPPAAAADAAVDAAADAAASAKGTASEAVSTSAEEASAKNEDATKIAESRFLQEPEDKREETEESAKDNPASEKGNLGHAKQEPNISSEGNNIESGKETSSPDATVTT